MVSFGLSLIALTYLIAFLFTNSNTAFKIIGLVYFIGGCILPTVVGGVLAALTGNIETVKVIKYFYALIPFQNFSDAMTFILLGNIYAELYGKDSEYYKRYMDALGTFTLCTPLLAIIVNCALAVLYFTLAVIIDSRKQTAYARQDTRVPTIFPRYLEADADVRKEETFVHSPEADNDDITVKVKELNKVYGNGYPAVSGTSFHIKKNEVLGLLGPNGAGKSTTFSILTMD